MIVGRRLVFVSKGNHNFHFPLKKRKKTQYIGKTKNLDL
jgi:hypothetical protein